MRAVAPAVGACAPGCSVVATACCSSRWALSDQKSVVEGKRVLFRSLVGEVGLLGPLHEGGGPGGRRLRAGLLGCGDGLLLVALGDFRSEERRGGQACALPISGRRGRPLGPTA